MLRYAVIEYPALQDTLEKIQRYMPENYTAFEIPDKHAFLIAGEDMFGWTLDSYVIPRLASGLIFAKELTPVLPPEDHWKG